MAQATAVTPFSLPLRCAVMIGAAALGDAAKVVTVYDETVATTAELPERFTRVRAHVTIADAAIEAFSMCGLSERWASLRALILSDDEVSVHSQRFHAQASLMSFVTSCGPSRQCGSI